MYMEESVERRRYVGLRVLDSGWQTFKVNAAAEGATASSLLRSWIRDYNASKLPRPDLFADEPSFDPVPEFTAEPYVEE